MNRPPAKCLEPGCPALVPYGRCPGHAYRAPVRHDTRLAADRANVDVRRWYRLVRWSYLRHAVLVDAAYTCASCGVVQVRLEVDHVVRHDGDPVLFWDRANLQALCPGCHATKTNRGE